MSETHEQMNENVKETGGSGKNSLKIRKSKSERQGENKNLG